MALELGTCNLYMTSSKRLVNVKGDLLKVARSTEIEKAMIPFPGIMHMHPNCWQYCQRTQRTTEVSHHRLTFLAFKRKLRQNNSHSPSYVNTKPAG